jgi:hypothetical protein
MFGLGLERVKSNFNHIKLIFDIHVWMMPNAINFTFKIDSILTLSGYVLMFKVKFIVQLTFTCMFCSVLTNGDD